MNRISQKCQYALRSLFELALRPNDGPVSVKEIAGRQAIPRRFLELIIKELKRAGIVQAYRGVHGGYTLAADPRTLSIGSVIRLMDGPPGPVNCLACGGERYCPLQGDDCAFSDMWVAAGEAAAAVYDSTTFQDLVS